MNEREQRKTDQPIAIIGGGLTGLTCAIYLAEQGQKVHLFEAAPQLGGRTRSFFDHRVNAWVDNGPHLLIGAYKATQKLLENVGIADNITWQSSLNLPLWDQKRGYFSLKPKSYLPFPLALLLALIQLPDHNFKSVQSMLRIARNMKNPTDDSVADWLSRLNISPDLQRDLIEPLCLGAMNEAVATADCKSFARVLSESFANHQSARLGWFNLPLSEALIEPLKNRLEKLGGVIFTSTTIRTIEQHDDHCTLQSKVSQEKTARTTPYANVVIALPAYARNRLLGIEQEVTTEAITNVHLWFDREITLPEPLVGGIGTYSQWFFDVSSQMLSTNSGEKKLSHICAVISAESPANREQTLQRVCSELEMILGREIPTPVASRIITEQRATVLVRDENNHHSHGMILDASEAPRPGDFPATIEAAVLRGEAAAKRLCSQQKQ